MNTITTKIEDMRAEGLSDAKIKAYLTLDDYSAKDIAAAFKELGGAKAVGFKSEFFGWLSKERRTKEEAEAYIMGFGEYGMTSSNVQKSLSTNMNIAELAASIWDVKPKAEAEAPNDRDAKIKAAWDKLATAQGKSRKTKSIHPDKVSHLEDDELTKAYSDYFKNA